MIAQRSLVFLYLLSLAHSSRVSWIGKISDPVRINPAALHVEKSLERNPAAESLCSALLEAASIQDSFVKECKDIFQDFRSISERESGHQEWIPRSSMGKRLKAAAGTEIDFDEITEKMGEEYAKLSSKPNLCSDKCHDSVEWLMTLLMGSHPHPDYTSNSADSDSIREVGTALVSALSKPADKPRLYVVRWADPSFGSYLIMTAHSWIILRMRGPDGSEQAMMLQSDANHFSLGNWMKGDSSLLPEGAQAAHEKFGKGQLIPLQDFADALQKVISSQSLKEFGLDAAGGIFLWQAFEHLNCEVEVTKEAVAQAMTVAKDVHELGRSGLFTQDDFP